MILKNFTRSAPQITLFLKNIEIISAQGQIGLVFELDIADDAYVRRKQHTDEENTMSEKVTIKLNFLNEVLSIENNNETENWHRVKISVGQRLPMQMVMLLCQNPSRFNIVR
jgi:hypothetical protein